MAYFLLRDDVLEIRALLLKNLSSHCYNNQLSPLFLIKKHHNMTYDDFLYRTHVIFNSLNLEITKRIYA